MPGENIYDWSTTAANNDTADALINWREGMARAAVNDSARSMMAAHAKTRDLLNGTIVTGGTPNAQTFISGYSFASIPTIPSGIRVLLKVGPGLTNTGATTLNMDGLGDLPVKDEKALDLAAGMLTDGSYGEFRYDGTNWVLLQAAFTTITVTNTTTDILNVTNEATINNLTTTTAIITDLTATTSHVTGNETVDGTLTAGTINSTNQDISGVEAIHGGSNSPLPGYAAALRIGCTGIPAAGIAVRMQFDGGYYLLMSNSVNTNIGGIQNISGGTVLYATLSDGDRKTDIEDLPSDVIDQLRPIKFKWKDHPDAGAQAGFIAQDVYPIVPQAVAPPSKDVPSWMMDYSKLVPLLVAELKSLRARVAELEAR